MTFTLITNTDSKLKRKDPQLQDPNLVLTQIFILGSISSHSNWFSQMCMNFTSSVCYAIWLDDVIALKRCARKLKSCKWVFDGAKKLQYFTLSIFIVTTSC